MWALDSFCRETSEKCRALAGLADKLRLFCFIHKYELTRGCCQGLKTEIIRCVLSPGQRDGLEKGSEQAQFGIGSGDRNALHPKWGGGRETAVQAYAAARRRFGFWSSISCAMRIKLLASTAAPTSISNLSRPLARHRFIPRPRNNTEMRPSMPTRNR